MKETVKIGLLGFGTVGYGVYDILKNNQEKYASLTQTNIEVSKILVHDTAAFPEALAAGIPLTDQFEEIAQDDSISIVVEVMGTVDVARNFITKALNSGKNVVTANKDLLAVHGEELYELAEKVGKDLYFEASVAGGIPILRALNVSYIGDNLQEVLGIVNGTTNFMLTKMQEEHYSYADALALAQQLGFAESDPTGDVEGLDAARKVVILTKLAFGKTITMEQLPTTGISALDLADFERAKALGYTIKLIGSSKVVDGHLNVEVAPMLVPLDHPLAHVKNENNAVYVTGEAVGETMMYGPGAGRMPTANSVVADILQVAKNIKENRTGKGLPIITSDVVLGQANPTYTDVLLRFKQVDNQGLTFAHPQLTQLDSADGKGYIHASQVSKQELEAIKDQLEKNHQLVFEAVYQSI